MLRASLVLIGLLLVLAFPVQAAEVFYLHTDHAGSVVMETDQQRNITWQGQYEPYGLPTQTTPEGPGYTGHVHDAASGLVYMQQRYYDPQVGRFLSVDSMSALRNPVAFFNLYSYAGNNPINATDPDGRRCIAVNVSSAYCTRRDAYRQFDGRLAGSTRFFGAAAMTVEYLANSDIPVAGFWLGPSSEAQQFLHEVSAALFSVNTQAYSQILSGSLAGDNLDSALIRMEQSIIQELLTALPDDARARIVDSLNSSFSRRWLVNDHEGDERYNHILDRVEKNLGRALDFGRQSDREAIGHALVRELRKSGACTPVGSRIPRC